MGGILRFKQLTTSNATSPPLIKQLYDGWETLNKSYPHLTSCVHFISNAHPSTSDRIKLVDDTTADFAQFLSQLWEPIRKCKIEPNKIPAKWQDIWNFLILSVGSNPQQFVQFVSCCELHFANDLHNVLYNEQDSILQRDIRDLSGWIFSSVASSSRFVEVSRRKLLISLNWDSRVDLTSRHDFPINYERYEPLSDSISDLEDALNQINGGYLALVGNPGSGKSTLLTDFLRNYTCRSIRYYAFVPDASTPNILRGEAENFLHDIVHQIESAGIRTGSSISNHDVTQLGKRFYDQLLKLGDDFSQKGKRTLILVDGLDHIEREQHPIRSLLKYLPDPNVIPDGVFIVLGTQTLEDLPTQIKTHLDCPGRTIVIKKLRKESVFALAARVIMDITLDESQTQALYDLSDGHPLALYYLLNQLRECDATERTKILESTAPFQGDITKNYETYWSQIREDANIVEVAGLVARIQGIINLYWLDEKLHFSIIPKFMKCFGHFFRQEGKNRAYIFHNSFRLFLQSKTAEIAFGQFSEDREKYYYIKLADFSRQSPPDSLEFFDLIYYLFMAQEHEQVLENISWESLKNQFMFFRSTSSINDDLRMGLQSAAKLKRATDIARFLLMAAEYAQRSENLNAVDINHILLCLNEYERVISRIRNGNILLINEANAMNLAVSLLDLGYQEEAQIIFDLAEPLNILATSEPLEEFSGNEDRILIDTWMTTAVAFRPLNTILSNLNKIKIETIIDTNNDNDVTRAYHNKMRTCIGKVLIDRNRWEDFEFLLSSFDPHQSDDLSHWYWLIIEACWIKHKTNNKLAKEFLNRIEQTITELKSPLARIALAEIYLHVNSDKKTAIRLIKDIQQPTITQITTLGNRDLMDIYELRIRLNRILYALGVKHSIEKTVPLTDDDKEELVYFERAICKVARMWGAAWAAEALDNYEVKSLLRFFNRSVNDNGYNLEWNAVLRYRLDFFNLLIQALSDYGQEALDNIQQLFVEQWHHQEHKDWWPDDLRQGIVRTLGTLLEDKCWAKQELESIEVTIGFGYDPRSKVEILGEQIDTWLEIGCKDKARETFIKMLFSSLGIGYRKDFQLESWLGWLQKVNAEEPEKSIERISWLARCIVSLEEYAETRTIFLASQSLLELTFRVDPVFSTTLFQWFYDQESLSYNDGLCSLLKSALLSSKRNARLVQVCLEELLLPITNSVDTELLISLVTALKAMYSKEIAIEHLNHLLLRINTYGVPSARVKWRLGLSRACIRSGIDLSKVGLKSEDLNRLDKEDDSSLVLKLNDEQMLIREVVESKCCKISDVTALMTKEESDSYFDWRSTIQKVLSSSTEQEIKEFAILLLNETKDRKKSLVCILSQELLRRGKNASALNIAEKILQATEIDDWTRHLGGGSRTQAWSILVQIDPEKAREKIIDEFILDVTSNYWYPYSVVRELESLMSLFCDSIPVRKIWEDVDKYLQHLFASVNITESTPEISIQHDKEITAQKALTCLLIGHVTHPVRILSQGARRGIIRLLKEKQLGCKEALEILLQPQNDFKNEIGLSILQSSLSNSQLDVKGLGLTIENLLYSPSANVRILAESVLSMLGYSPKIKSSRKIVEPKIYSMILELDSKEIEVLSADKASDGKPLPYTDDPLKIISIYSRDIELLSKTTSIPYENLCIRNYNLMKQIAPQSFWSEKYEEELRSKIDSAWLKFAFQRPRALYVRLALNRLIAELIDCDRLKINSISDVSPIVCCYDPEYMVSEPMIRPNEISTMTGLTKYGTPTDDWLEQDDQMIENLFAQKIGENIVLAECSSLACNTQSHPKEIRCSSIYHIDNDSSPEAFNEPESIFGTLVKCVAENYIIEGNRCQEKLIILMNHIYDLDSPGANWIALNPDFAQFMGWQLADDYPFGWIDCAGNPMVWSFWWRDGSLDDFNNRHDNEFGEGMLVLASQEGFQQILEKIPEACKVMCVQRTLRSRNSSQCRTYYGQI